MRTVSEVSKISKITVRTLQYYDSIGLLSPSKKTEAGYRLYSQDDINKLGSVLILKELQFSLKNIKKIINSENFDIELALDDQIELLKKKRDRLDKIISMANNIKQKGMKTVDFNVFDNDEMENLKNEAKEKWGNTKEYKEFEKRGNNNAFDDKLMEIFIKIGDCKDLPVNDEKVQSKIKELQNHISKNYYTCSDEILLSLGRMYVEDKRFKENIDNAGGKGTAEFTEKAITEYCKNK